MKRILFSLYDTKEARNFAVTFYNLGWEIICTKETFTILTQAGIPATSIEEFTGVHDNYGIPPTLHPKIEAGLTGDRPEWHIDIVFDITYPLSTGNDVGGLTLLALAAKGARVPVMSVADMKKVINELNITGEVSDDFKNELITKANAYIAGHYIELLRTGDGPGDGIVGINVMELPCGENPYQAPCHLFASLDDIDPLSMHKFKVLSKQPPCFTGFADLDSVIQTLCLAQGAFLKKFGKAPYLALASKHGNPCGFSADWDNPALALEKALFGNAPAIWGGEVILNFPVTKGLADLLYRSELRKNKLGNPFWMLDLIAAPSFSNDALTMLNNRQARKILENSALRNPQLIAKSSALRPVRGGFLRQPPANYILDFNNVELVGSCLTDTDYSSLILAWAAAWSSSLGGNEVTLVNNLQLIGSGGGPATKIAVSNAVTIARGQGHGLEKTVFAANAFFPYIDGPQILADAGCILGLVPKGGKGKEEIRSFFRAKNINMCFLPEEMRGFCRH